MQPVLRMVLIGLALATAPRAVCATPSPRAGACGKCHQPQLKEWLSSQHAWAARPVDPALDGAAFTKPAVAAKLRGFAARQNGKRLEIETAGPDGKSTTFSPIAVIGVEPLRQFLFAFPGGRSQVLDIAFDPAHGEWFDINPDENRQAHEWGYWTNRGMNWNSQCGSCHMTGFKKAYNSASDSYSTTWEEFGVSCTQCHGPMTRHAAAGERSTEERLTMARSLEVCATCHTRQEHLTGDFRAGEQYLDHFRPILMDTPDLFFADGQVKAEDFEWGAFQHSRMSQMGVTCLDCHNPHSGKLTLPVTDNALCLKCHQPPGSRGAAPITAVHAHHKAGSKGALCVECHMPKTVYMARDARRDHSFTKPDPLLTKELGIPNACNRCHEDRTVDWSIEWVDTWFPEKKREATRGRTRAIAAVQRGEEAAVPALLAELVREKNPVRRAEMTALLGPWAMRADASAELEKALDDESPLARSAAVRAGSHNPALLSRLRSRTTDPVRLVRLDALLARPGPGRPNAELERYLALGDDQPAGALKRAHVAVSAGDMATAVRALQRAMSWDPGSAVTHAELARILHTTGKTREAAREFEEAVRLEPNRAEHRFSLGLLHAETGNLAGAREALENAVAIDPSFGRCWYDLGLVQAKLGRLSEALQALRRAEALMPASPDPLVAQAALLRQTGWSAAARELMKKAQHLGQKR